MSAQLEHESLAGVASSDEHRERLIAAIPVADRRLEIAGVATALLEGGEGPSIVLLHGPGEFAAKWSRVIPRLLADHHVVAPDFPGHGASEPVDDLDVDRVFSWLGELVERTCPDPPILVGHLLGGSVAARFAVEHGDSIAALVLVDSFGLGRFRPSPTFALALAHFMARPSERSYHRFMGHCLVNRDGVREEMEESWDALRDYSLDRARSKQVKASMRFFMKELGVPVIPPDDLARISVPTTLIWGREDRANRLHIAESASDRYGWPLHVIDAAADDPPLDRPDAFVDALRAAIPHTPDTRRTS